jgi:hypothetical protein
LKVLLHPLSVLICFNIVLAAAEFSKEWRVKMCDAESCAAVQSLVLELEEVLFFLPVSCAVILSSQIFSSTFFAIFARHNPCKVKVLLCHPAYLHTESTIL